MQMQDWFKVYKKFYDQHTSGHYNFTDVVLGKANTKMHESFLAQIDD